MDYKDKLPVVGSLWGHLPLEQLWDTNQCVVIHITAALTAARTRVWPGMDEVSRAAAKLKADMWKAADRIHAWLGDTGEFVTFGEGEMRQGLHDARNPVHNWDFHARLFLEASSSRKEEWWPWGRFESMA